MMHTLTILMYVFVLVIGAVSAYIGLANQGDISAASKGCSGTLQNANTGLIMLSMIMLTGTVVSGYCSFSCGSIKGDLPKKLKNTYYGFVLFVFIALTVVGVLMKTEADDKGHECPDVKKRAALLMYTGIAGIVFFFMVGGLTIVAHNKKGDGSIEMDSLMCSGKRSEA